MKILVNHFDNKTTYIIGKWFVNGNRKDLISEFDKLSNPDNLFFFHIKELDIVGFKQALENHDFNENVNLFASSDDVGVRAAVAIISEDQKTLENLAGDSALNVRCLALSNEHCSVDLLEKALMQASNQDFEKIAEAVLKNQNCPADLALKLSKHENPVIRFNVLNSRHKTKEILLDLSKDDDDVVAEMALYWLP